MNQGSRLALILAAVALLVGGFFLAQGSDDGDDDDAATTTVATTAVTTPATTTSAATTATTPPPPPPPPIDTVRVRNGKPVGGVKSLRFDKGDRVRFRVISDVADHVHVHGYDLMKDVAPGQSATFSFKATFDGKYEIELEERQLEIASLTIEP